MRVNWCLRLNGSVELKYCLGFFLFGLEMFENVSRLTNSKWIWVIAMELCQRNNFNLYLTCVQSNTIFWHTKVRQTVSNPANASKSSLWYFEACAFSCTWKLFSDTFFFCAVVFNLHNHPSSTKKTECRAESVEQKFTIHNSQTKKCLSKLYHMHNTYLGCLTIAQTKSTTSKMFKHNKSLIIKFTRDTKTINNHHKKRRFFMFHLISWCVRFFSLFHFVLLCILFSPLPSSIPLWVFFANAWLLKSH